MNNKLSQVISKFKELTKLDCYEIKCVEGEPSIRDTKIGGEPYLPIHEDYPVDKQGNPLPLFVQINFEGFELENYPNKGVLQIFSGVASTGLPTEYAIKYYKDISLAYQNNIVVTHIHNSFVRKPIKIEFEKAQEYMPTDDYRFSSTFRKIFNEIFNANTKSILGDVLEMIDDKNFFYDFNEKELTILKGAVGGYASFTQFDPREDGHLDADKCILKINSNLHKDIYMGDGGNAWLLISSENLINKQFDMAVFDWDCC